MAESTFGNIITFLFLGAIVITIARNAYGKRHWIGWHVTKFLIFLFGVTLILALARVAGFRGWWLQYLAIGLATPVFVGWQWKRSRRIPEARRRRTIEKWETRTGQKFDPKTHEIDHIVPFAKGGWHTPDNLRVMRKDANRRKGHREPSLADWFHIWRGKEE